MTAHLLNLPSRAARSDPPSFLLIGPYDPHGGEYTFLAPPLGVWRLQGVLENAGYVAEVFDPNITDGNPRDALDEVLQRRRWDVMGTSTTGMTLRYDLALAHRARRAQPDALLVAGGMEATFRPELMFEIGPFDLVVLGEGEKPLLEIGRRRVASEPHTGITGTAWLDESGKLTRRGQMAMTQSELSESVAQTPYERMPYRAYWERLETAYRTDQLPFKAERETRLAEIRSIRLNTLNYCPMNCSFCSSTNFLHAAQGSVAKVGRLTADECLTMIGRIVDAFPDVRTVIFQDDIFVFTNDDRILPLCEGIVAAKEAGRLPHDLQFISTNRIDAMTTERLVAMKAAGFRVLGFGIESFSPEILEEFNKSRIAPYVEPCLEEALRLGLTPFLDLILTSPNCSLEALGETIRSAYRWMEAGCEMGMYPYVIPFSGAAMAEDPRLVEHTLSVRHEVEGTSISWEQPAKIPPVDPTVRSAILEIERRFEASMVELANRTGHVPSRVRSLVWIASAIPVLQRHGLETPVLADVEARLDALPGIEPRVAVAESSPGDIRFAPPQQPARVTRLSAAPVADPVL